VILGVFMTKYYVFVDYDNIQPEAETLSFFYNTSIKIIIFVNCNQKLSVEVVKMLQPFGDRVEYLELNVSGKNAWDFMIAFHIGQIWVDNPEAKYIVVSKDTGFDPLMKHLNAKRSGAAKRLNDFNLKGLEMNQPEPPNLPVIINEKVLNTCETPKTLPEKNLPISNIALASLVITTKNDLTSLKDSDFLERHLADLLNYMAGKELISIDKDGLKNKLENVIAGAMGPSITNESPKEPQVPTNACLSKTDMAAPKEAPPLSSEDCAEIVCSFLKKYSQNQPTTIKTLTNAIKSLFQNKLSDTNISSVLNVLKNKKILAVTERNKISYNLK
jgi:hypothetical protein